MKKTGTLARPRPGRPPTPPAPLPAPAPDPARLGRLAPLPAHPTDPVLDLVVPVFNEEAVLERSVRRLHAHLRETFPYPYRITVADNASTDATPVIAARLARQLPDTEWTRLEEKGRGRALRAAWSRSRAPVLAYTDVDLSTGLAALLPLVAPLISGHSGLAVGTRLAPGARVVRGPKREAVSRCYNLLLRATLGVGFSDAQCGFKAVRRETAERLLPLVEDTGWFFDTELLVAAERAGLRVHEVPVDWVDDPDSRVDLLPTALADLRGIARLLRTGGRVARPGPGRTGPGRTHRTLRRIRLAADLAPTAADRPTGTEPTDPRSTDPRSTDLQRTADRSTDPRSTDLQRTADRPTDPRPTDLQRTPDRPTDHRPTDPRPSDPQPSARRSEVGP